MKPALLLAILLVVAFAVVWLLISPTEKINDEGKTSYERRCKHCHALFEDAMGGPMYGMLERTPGKEWIYKFIRNPAEMSYTDPYGVCLKKKYGIVMTGFLMTDKEIDSIYTYVYAEAKKKKDIWNNKKFFISCK